VQRRSWCRCSVLPGRRTVRRGATWGQRSRGAGTIARALDADATPTPNGVQRWYRSTSPESSPPRATEPLPPATGCQVGGRDSSARCGFSASALCAPEATGPMGRRSTSCSVRDQAAYPNRLRLRASLQVAVCGLPAHTTWRSLISVSSVSSEAEP
jgi:hypothetical protein